MTPCVILIEPAGRSGVAQFVYGLASALAEREVDVTVVTAYAYELENYPRTFRLERVFRSYRTNPVRVFLLLRRLARRHPCVMDLHGATHPELYLPLLWTIRWLIGAKIVYTTHDPAPRQWAKFPQWILKWMYRIPHRIQTLSPGTRDILIQRYAVAEDRVSVIPFANCLYLVQDPSMSDSPVATFERHPTRTGSNVLFLGFITPNKGLMDLIRAFAAVQEAVPDATLTIAGQPAENFEKYEREIQRLGLFHKVITHLKYLSLSDVLHHLENCAVVALPYRSATQSGVVQIAYALRKAIVATNCPGLANHIVDGKSGILVPVGNVAAMSAALIDLLQAEERRTRLGLYGRWLAETRFSWHHTSHRVRRVYETV